MTDLRKAAEALRLAEILSDGNPMDCLEHSDDASAELLRLHEENEALRQALAESANSTTDFVESKALAQPKQDCYGYASRLATYIWEKHYKEDSPEWKPFNNLEGVLTQIDNMVCGLVKAQPKQEPVWSAEECDRVVKTLRYIQGIAERGEGRAMRDDETLEQFVLGYVKKLEQPEQEPVFRIPNAQSPFKPDPLNDYTAPLKRKWVGLTDDEIKEIVGPWGDTPIKGYTRKLFDQIEAKLKEKNT